MIEKKFSLQIIRDECPGLLDAYERIPLITPIPDTSEELGYDQEFLDFLIKTTRKTDIGAVSWSKSK